MSGRREGKGRGREDLPAPPTVLVTPPTALPAVSVAPPTTSETGSQFLPEGPQIGGGG